jgi:hypothetical protein
MTNKQFSLFGIDGEVGIVRPETKNLLYCQPPSKVSLNILRIHQISRARRIISYYSAVPSCLSNKLLLHMNIFF